MATPISFTFAAPTEWVDRFDLTARLDMKPVNGYMILTNGIDPNQKGEPDAGMTDLIPRAPRDEVYPLITGAPSSLGKIFGNSYKWRVRYRNSKTGETTGLSALPSMGYNLGRETYTGSGSHLGQTAYFSFTGFAYATSGDYRAGMDTIQLCRNTDSQTRVFYVVDEKANPGAAGTVTFTDNTPDEDLINNVQVDLVVNPSYYTPTPPPCVRSYLHGTRRLWLYGHINMGPHTSHGNSSTMSPGDTLVTCTNGFTFRGREGMRFNYDTDPDKTDYRLIEVVDGNTLYVTPPAPATINTTWRITDDIDTRNIYMMEPNQPWSFDSTNVFTVGADLSDGVMGVFAIGTKTYVLTRRNLWGLSDDLTEDPKTTIRIDHIASVGCVGHWAWCETPYGVVFVDENKGVMAYSGDGLPTALGSESPLDEFKPKTQFQNFDRGLLGETYCEWDPDAQRVFVSYCPVGVAALVEQLSFDPSTSAGNWRGPWRRPLYRGGKLRDRTGKDIFLLGDMTGTLCLENDIPTDLVTVVSGTLSSMDSPVVLTATASVFTSSMVGASILMNDLAGNYYWNIIGKYIGGTQVVLLLVPEATFAPGATFQVGVIHWQAKTAFLDLGDPGQPKVIRKLEVGYNRIASGVDNLRVDGVSEGIAITETADPATVAAGLITAGLVKGSVDLNLGGSAFTLRFAGRASYGNPQVTKVRLDVSVDGGEEVLTAGDAKRVTIVPTVTA